MQVTIEQAVKEAVDFPKAKGLVPSHRLAPRIMVAYAEIRDLPARGKQPIHDVRRIQIHAGLSWFSIFQKVTAPCQILLLAGILTLEMRGWLRLAIPRPRSSPILRVLPVYICVLLFIL
jgi:hypothetical protein